MALQNRSLNATEHIADFDLLHLKTFAFSRKSQFSDPGLAKEDLRYSLIQFAPPSPIPRLYTHPHSRQEINTPSNLCPPCPALPHRQRPTATATHLLLVHFCFPKSQRPCCPDMAGTVTVFTGHARAYGIGDYSMIIGFTYYDCCPALRMRTSDGRGSSGPGRTRPIVLEGQIPRKWLDNPVIPGWNRESPALYTSNATAPGRTRES
jgi:hypothetical protein